MKKLLAGTAIALSGLLSACFLSETPFIAEGESTALPEGAVQFCSNAEECAEGALQEDGSYLLIPPPEEDDAPIPLRLAPLLENDLGQIWIVEIKMIEEDETMYSVGVARRAPEFDGDLPAYEVALPDCSEVTPEEAETYGVEKIDKGTCAMPALVPVTDYLSEAYAERLNDPQWWEDND
ncbi:MAG: hypothetical protein R3C13_07945 [Hyphomonas sp.]|uniref:hypothetical protein n=1 Tax=Hyphomonas sp. TaxID=87 RepID=UPI003528ED96